MCKVPSFSHSVQFWCTTHWILLLADSKLTFTCKKISALFSAVPLGRWLASRLMARFRSLFMQPPLSSATDHRHDDGDMPHNASVGGNNGFTLLRVVVRHILGFWVDCLNCGNFLLWMSPLIVSVNHVRYNGWS